MTIIDEFGFGSVRGRPWGSGVWLREYLKANGETYSKQAHNDFRIDLSYGEIGSYEIYDETNPDPVYHLSSYGNFRVLVSILRRLELIRNTRTEPPAYKRCNRIADRQYFEIVPENMMSPAWDTPQKYYRAIVK